MTGESSDLPKYCHDRHSFAMIITVMDVTYCGMILFTAGMILMNIGYFFYYLMKYALVISSIGFCILMLAIVLAQHDGSDEVILYDSGGGCTGLIAVCTAQAEKIPTS
jgi:hypothetical protein